MISETYFVPEPKFLNFSFILAIFSKKNSQMSHTTEADYKKQIEESDLREVNFIGKRAVESAQKAAEETLKAHDQLTTMAYNEKDLVDAELAAALKLQTIPVTSFNTPVPQTPNLSNQRMKAGGYTIDDQRLNDALHRFGREIDERLTILTNEALARWPCRYHCMILLAKVAHEQFRMSLELIKCL